jgi:hypothetical protein
MWYEDFLWGAWNGVSAWVVLAVHAFGGWDEFPFFNNARGGNWYHFGFLLGAGSPVLGVFGTNQSRRRGR